MQDLVRRGTAPTGTDAVGSSGSTHDSHPSRGEVRLLATLMARVDDRIVSRGAAVADAISSLFAVGAVDTTRKPLPPQIQQPKTAGANSKLDKTWGQGQLDCQREINSRWTL